MACVAWASWVASEKTTRQFAQLEEDSRLASKRYLQEEQVAQQQLESLRSQQAQQAQLAELHSSAWRGKLLGLDAAMSRLEVQFLLRRWA